MRRDGQGGEARGVRDASQAAGPSAAAKRRRKRSKTALVLRRICADHGIEISATRVRKVVKHFEAEPESTGAWRKILEQTTSALLRQSAQQ
jgi:hypothetical protein